MKQILYKRSRTVIRNWGEKIKDNLKRQLKIDRTYASGRTADSIEGKFTANNTTIRYDIESRTVKGVSILDVIDTGRKAGRRPPIPAIMEWMQRKGVNPQPGKYKPKKRTPSAMRQSAFLIARAIEKGGTIKRFGGGRGRGAKGSDILGFVIKSNEEQMMQDVATSFELDLADYIEGKVKQPRIGRR